MDANTPISRRIVFTGLGSLGIAAALAGCGTTPTSGTQPSTPATSGSPSGGSSSGAAPTPLATTSEIPVGGGIILSDQRLVITQPTAGTFDAFSAVCTHQGFNVTSVADGTISCAHHGSTYSASTGQVTGGPAPSALTPVAIKVKGGSIFAA
ncbi:hypothetical protein Back2_01460 [Nocardioides baekrokdamisoli]|uniref:Rieske domain-containing protein n=1 Tax=Nocardioides baekrokdamisoli TaxID=1804624 RepID=A0A3G9IYT1_9ACTN|nr:Rieske (2Fe-2S) protein [Nocardioides baekrokdamisoli]BBH15859.1 hypothetical protein Back2_01460 [Nocardioides baekrokdamisoli]